MSACRRSTKPTPPYPYPLLQPACGGMAVLISGAVFSLLSLPIFSVMVFIYLFYANIVLEVYIECWRRRDR